MTIQPRRHHYTLTQTSPAHQTKRMKRLHRSIPPASYSSLHLTVRRLIFFYRSISNDEQKFPVWPIEYADSGSQHYNQDHQSDINLGKVPIIILCCNCPDCRTRSARSRRRWVSRFHTARCRQKKTTV